jgi:hypothetical protein
LVWIAAFQARKVLAAGTPRLWIACERAVHRRCMGGGHNLLIRAERQSCRQGRSFLLIKIRHMFRMLLILNKRNVGFGVLHNLDEGLSA